MRNPLFAQSLFIDWRRSLKTIDNSFKKRTSAPIGFTPSINRKGYPREARSLAASFCSTPRANSGGPRHRRQQRRSRSRRCHHRYGLLPVYWQHPPPTLKSGTELTLNLYLATVVRSPGRSESGSISAAVSEPSAGVGRVAAVDGAQPGGGRGKPPGPAPWPAAELRLQCCSLAVSPCDGARAAPCTDTVSGGVAVWPYEAHGCSHRAAVSQCQCPSISNPFFRLGHTVTVPGL